MANKFLYFFGNGKAEGDAQMKDILGGKGANLAEMSKIGIPVPCGFTISTEQCNEYYKNSNTISKELIDALPEYIKRIETETGFSFGSDTKPLLVSIRSGAKFSMPGMMDTILNLGMNDKTVEVIANLTNNKRFAYDSYRRFMQMYGDVVLGINHDKFEGVIDDIKFMKNIDDDAKLTTEDFTKVIREYKKIILKETGKEFEQDITKQLLGAIEAVFKSWMNDRACVYRKLHHIPDSCGTAVNIQAMVFGNMGDTSATGVCFTRNPSTGEKKLYGEYLVNAQGEDVVAGIRTPYPLLKVEGDNSLEEIMPNVFKELLDIFNKLENHYKDMQDVEFTVQEGKLWILQTRNGKRAAKAAVRIATSLVKEGLITKEEAIMKVDPSSLHQLLHPVLDRSKKLNVIARGLPASPGAVSGKVVFTSEEAVSMAGKGSDVILVRSETSPDDIAGMHSALGILTCKGGMTSHAAVVARGMGKPCISGCESIYIADETIHFKQGDMKINKHDIITLDGATGEVILGRADTVNSIGFDEFEELMSWVNDIKDMKVRANAETGIDCKVAMKFGADGIGLCRTEHMFFDKEKLLHFRRMILAKDKVERVKSLEKIESLQSKDFIEIFEIMKGLPVNIRLLDPPLHEFLPTKRDEIDVICKEFDITQYEVETKINSLHETNPMLGHRGSRLGITYPEIFEMQARAIINAAILSEKNGILPQIEIMLPIIIDKSELQILSDKIKFVADKLIADNKSSVKYKLGTMIEIPRACLVADEIAQIADYFSFGTNDLTQTGLGISRDDATKFINEYVHNNIFPKDPFVSVDQKGVGGLMKIAIEKARSVKPNITLSVCGEHGGDPESIMFFHKLGLNYVSCSPYRIPIAKLASAQAVIVNRK